jgi:hypothetical protein
MQISTAKKDLAEELRLAFRPRIAIWAMRPGGAIYN